jgi:hypothetical protein
VLARLFVTPGKCSEGHVETVPNVCSISQARAGASLPAGSR